MRVKSATSIGLAVAAASLFATAPIVAQEGSESEVHCYGVTACKGQNDCKTAENACKGQGECKGHGFLAMSAEECEAKGGEVGE